MVCSNKLLPWENGSLIVLSWQEDLKKILCDWIPYDFHTDKINKSLLRT